MRRLLAALEPHWARHSREAGPEREHLDPLTCLGQCVGEAQIVLSAGFHRAGDVDEQQHLARPHPALESRQLDELAIVARRIPQRATQVDHGPAPRALDAGSSRRFGSRRPSLAGQAPWEGFTTPASAGPKRRSTKASATGRRPGRICSFDSSAVTGSSAPRRSSWTRDHILVVAFGKVW